MIICIKIPVFLIMEYSYLRRKNGDEIRTASKRLTENAGALRSSVPSSHAPAVLLRGRRRRVQNIHSRRLLLRSRRPDSGGLPKAPLPERDRYMPHGQSSLRWCNPCRIHGALPHVRTHSRRALHPESTFHAPPDSHK